MILVDAHLDIAYNALNFGRSPLLSLAQLRQHEAEDNTKGLATVTFPELQKAKVGLIFATLYVSPATSPFPSLHDKVVYHNSAQAHQQAMAQLDFYHRLADENETVRLVFNQLDLQDVIKSQGTKRPLLGLVILMEGADPIRHPAELELWYERGLRLIGPAWDDTRYAAGAWRDSRKGLSRAGYHLLEVMAHYNMILDLTHMSEKGTLQSLDRYPGPIVATHSNVRHLVPGERQLSDKQIRRIGERGGVIGVVLFNAFLKAGYSKTSQKAEVTLEHVIAHIDHICQCLGDANHIGIGSDFDGGFGTENIPAELASCADLPLIAGRLLNRGYSNEDVDNIMGKNWLTLLQQVLP